MKYILGNPAEMEQILEDRKAVPPPIGHGSGPDQETAVTSINLDSTISLIDGAAPDDGLDNLSL